MTSRRRLTTLATIFISIGNSSALASTACETWFKKAKIKIGPGCELKCAMQENDMSNFHCTEECEDLCKTPIKEQLIIGLADLYPGLTDAEKALAALDPLKTLKAYQLSWNAESQCNEIYAQSRHNDESDACRHFVWAATMSKDLGKDFASKVLSAHEAEPDQSIDEKNMDDSNNARGLLAADRLKEKPQSSIIQEFQNDLKSKKMVILKSRFNKRGK
ncbi:MAG: DUF6973 domain-containing protein [Bdellovibrionales bacterium]